MTWPSRRSTADMVQNSFRVLVLPSDGPGDYFDRGLRMSQVMLLGSFFPDEINGNSATISSTGQLITKRAILLQPDFISVLFSTEGSSLGIRIEVCNTHHTNTNVHSFLGQYNKNHKNTVFNYIFHCPYSFFTV
ncbi:uncharacterized protein LOC119769818 [Culex quinquefasciatus]|uniref:uncharacterized protein LOC119769818 n=1 Tax=Culex quinquefasciatus TaxID=7176 RepID=UPI0018E30EAC|nr:uncharacterized protein LOC119769818 [Culex quinquefasciatus]